jgi:hypothetical protein
MTPLSCLRRVREKALRSNLDGNSRKRGEGSVAATPVNFQKNFWQSLGAQGLRCLTDCHFNRLFSFRLPLVKDGA